MLENVSSRKRLSLIVIIAVSIALAIYFVQGITSNTSATNKAILNLASDTNLDVDAVFTSDGNTALLPTISHLYIIDIPSGKIIKLINLASDTMPGVDVVFTADDMIAVLPTTSHLYMIEIPSGGIKELINLASDTNTDVDVVITPDGNTALLPTTSHLYIIDIHSGNIKALINLASNTQKCVDVMITPDGNTALLPTTSHLYIIDIPSGNVRELLNLASDTNLEVDLRITPDGNTALLPTTSHLYIIDVSSGNIQALLNLASNTMPGVDIVITPEGNTALLPTILHLHVIDVSSGNIKTLLNLASNTMPGVDIVVTPEGNTAFLPTTSHLYLIDVSSGNIKTLLNLASDTMKGVDIVVTPEGNRAFLPTSSHLYMIDVSSGNIKTLLNLASDTNRDIDLEIVCPIISSLPGSIAILPTESHLYIIDGLPQDNVLLPTISHLYMLNVQSCNIKELLNLASDTMRGVDVVIARNILTADPDEDFPVLPTSTQTLPPHPHREKLIFSIEAGELEKDLDEGTVPERLEEKFEAEKIPLSEDVIVEKSGDGKWTIKDKKKEYIARKREGMIDVYTPREPVKSIVPRSDNFNHIKIQTEPQKVLIGQNLQFEGFDGTVTVSRIVSGDVENVYQADANNRIYNVNWPTSGAFYVNYQELDQAQLSVEKPKMPLELKVETKKVSSIAVGTDIIIDTSGMNLFPGDQVDLVVVGPDGQIKYDEVNNQQFTDITVAELVSNFSGSPNSLETSRWAIGNYTFQVKTEAENACGLEAESEVVAILLTPELTAYLSVPSVALEDDFTVFGTAQGQSEVVILSVPPKGGGGKSLLDKGEKGLSSEKASVSTTDYTYSKKMTVQEDATAGYYDIYVLCAGMDDVWGMTGQKDLEAALNQKFHISSLTCEEGSAICTKTQEEIEDILEDLVTTEGSDDLMVKMRLKVETVYIRLDPVANVNAGTPLVVTGKSNRQEGYAIVVTCKGPVELEPQVVKIENDAFTATFDTTGALTGEYNVKADDGDGHTDEVDVFITGKGMQEAEAAVEEVVEEAP